ncbi:MAG: hypothetical protein NT012_01635 [Candidatus Nealsonbacteria bacterium]|jgi:hypothetical protein|nr:hypothetical protein [Candidatus Nealsonbacteria bacterium]
MVKKIIFFILIFYVLTLIQTSFLVHFNVSGVIPNLVLITVIFINLLPESQRRVKNRIYSLRLSSSWLQKISSAVIGGFYLDIFSLNNMGGFFGFYTLILTGFSFLLKTILERYVRIPIIQKI